MNRAELREIVSTILTSDDPSLRAGDRLRAAQMLRELDDGPDLDDLIAETTTALRGEELNAWLDATLAALLLATDHDAMRERWPQTARVLDDRATAERARRGKRRRTRREPRRRHEIPEPEAQAIPAEADRKTAPIALEIVARESVASAPAVRRTRRRRIGNGGGWHPL